MMASGRRRRPGESDFKSLGRREMLLGAGALRNLGRGAAARLLDVALPDLLGDELRRLAHRRGRVREILRLALAARADAPEADGVAGARDLDLPELARATLDELEVAQDAGRG